MKRYLFFAITALILGTLALVTQVVWISTSRFIVEAEVLMPGVYSLVFSGYIIMVLLLAIGLIFLAFDLVNTIMEK